MGRASRDGDVSPVTASNPAGALGRDLVHNLFVALRSAQLYEPTNATLQAAAGRLSATIRELHLLDGVARFEVGRDIVLVNDARVRSELRSYTIHANIQRFFAALEIGGFEWTEVPDDGEAARFAGIVGRLEGTGATTPDRLAISLAESGIGVAVLPPRPEAPRDPFEDPNRRARAERTYRHSVAVTRDLMESTRTGRALQRFRVRRAVQSIVDQVLEDETLLVGLTNLRDYDEPTFTHSVNVCIFAVSLGQKIGLTRLELYELGMAALLHDIGKVDVPHEVLNKAGALTREEWSVMRRHTRYGAWRLVADRTPGSMPIHEMLVAFEHHLHLDLTGYPNLFSDRRLCFYSKIVEICDSYDAGTTPRVYKSDPITPAQMIEILDRGKGVRWDPILIKAFISLLGLYPVGCYCLLDTMEKAVVVAADPENVHRPRVKLVYDPSGNPQEGPVVSLAERDAGGEFMRTVIKVLDPERDGIDVAGAFLASAG
ncbi:MAG TPA: HD domain-containing phosphohydrolase [Gemmatimonadota bacterium]|nr:HD domain-containing phosphohydrolase [Gemmatimonadota bacterium]